MVIVVLGKATSHRVPKLDSNGAKSPGWFDVLPRISARDVRHDQMHSHSEAANHQLPRAADFQIIRILSTEECSSFTQNLMQIRCSILSHFEFDGHTVHMFTQWHLLPLLTSTVKSSLFMHAHSSPLSLDARLHRCHANHSHYTKSSWAFSGQSSSYI